MEVEEIRKVIADQKAEINDIFKDGKIIDRAVPDLSKFLSHPNILAILGIRRCGKSTLSLQIAKGKNFGYVNFDDERFYGLETKDLNKVLESVYIENGDVDFLILDEIQNVPAWELFANRLRRTKKLIVTGSSAKLLSGELATHLTGRYTDFTLLPFSFTEFLAIKGLDFRKEETYSTKETAEIKRNLNEYMTVGGFPEVHKLGTNVVPRIYGDIVQKDILLRYKIRNKKTFRDIGKYLISNFGCEMTFSKLKNVSSVKNVHTVKNYVDYFAQSYVIFTLERFSFKLKQQMIAPKKIYCIDNGMINAIAFKPFESSGKLLENLVALEILRRRSYYNDNWEIFYWKDHQQNEVDFVIKEGPTIKQLIQVTYASGKDDVEKRETKALLKAAAELRCKSLLVITWDYEAEEAVGEKIIRFVPLWKWLLSRQTASKINRKRTNH